MDSTHSVICPYQLGYVCVCVCACIHTYMRTCITTRQIMYVHTYVCTCMYTHAHACTHIQCLSKMNVFIYYLFIIYLFICYGYLERPYFQVNIHPLDHHCNVQPIFEGHFACRSAWVPRHKTNGTGPFNPGTRTGPDRCCAQYVKTGISFSSSYIDWHEGLVKCSKST